MAGDKVTITLVGIHGRGKTMAQWFGALPDVRIPVVCDVDSNIVGPVTKMVTESQGKAPVLVSDILALDLEPLSPADRARFADADREAQIEAEAMTTWRRTLIEVTAG